MPEFSIIIPVYNRPDEVADLLDSLEKQSHAASRQIRPSAADSM